MAFPLLGAFLAASIGPLVKKALVALGFGTVTYVGLQAAFDGAKTAIMANYGQISAPALQIIDMAGVGTSIGILLGAVSARVGIAVVSKFTKIL